MKLALIALTSLVFSCAVHSQVAPPAPTPTVDFTPPTDFEMELKERARRKHEAEVSEQKAYDESLAKITKQIREEGLNLAMCAEVGAKEECDAIRAGYCKVMLIDSRGGHWLKPFCK